MTDWQANEGLMQAVDDFMQACGPAADNLATEIASAYSNVPLPELLGSVMAYLAYVQCYNNSQETAPHLKVQIAFQDVIALPFVQQLATKAIGEQND